MSATRGFDVFLPDCATMTKLSCVMYTRAGCCLCDIAQELLERYGLLVDTVDIDRDETLRERYTNCVPVVLIDGRERFRGRVDETLLRRLIDAGRR